MGRKFGFSFSWKRATGISGAKGRISRKIGVPLTRSGRRKKVGRAAGCFVATAVYGDADAPDVLLLRDFRDQILNQHTFGRAFIYVYYRMGPLAAWIIERTPALKCLSCRVIKVIANLIESRTTLQRRPSQ